MCIAIGFRIHFFGSGMDKNIKYIHSLAATICKEVGRQICRDCVLTVKRIAAYMSVDKDTVGCFLVEAFKFHLLLES